MINHKVEIGSTHPVSVRYIGAIGQGKWQVWNIITNKVYKTYTSCAAAHSLAKSIKDHL